MVKKIISVATAFLMLCCMIPFAAFADVLDTCPKCGERTYVTEADLEAPLTDTLGFPVKYTVKHCSSCGYAYYEWLVFGIPGYQEFDKGGYGQFTDYLANWLHEKFGVGANGLIVSQGNKPGGVGRKDLPGYQSSDNNPGVPSISQDGNIALLAKYRFTNNQKQLVDSFSKQVGNDIWNFGENSLYIERYSNSQTYCYTYGGYILDTNNIPGIYYIPAGTSYVFNPWGDSYKRNLNKRQWPEIVSKSIASVSSDGTKRYICIYKYNADRSSQGYPDMSLSVGDGTDNIFRQDSGYTISTSGNITIPYPKDLVVYLRPTSTNIVKNTNITINNNTWNGNIYVDNSTNLTYIYPEYTTINENNETVTNISTNPIIYNSETKQYYTYDTVTNNYYYITYGDTPATPTPSPSPTPDPDNPDVTPTPTPEPGGDTGDTTGILAVLVEIRDNMIQGFLDIKAAFVAGFAELSANFTLAIENLNVNIQNIFDKKFPDQSTPETAQPSPSPSPSPDPSPSPTPDPDAPDTTPTPVPTDKPSGGNTTNNFWNIIFPSFSDDGTDSGHKGIFWALVSLILAIIAFFTNMLAGYKYLFPFLPDGVVMTINACVFVLFLFVVIKFIMRSK